MKLLRARPLEFVLPDGRSFVITPPTIGRVRACFELDPEDPEKETPAARKARIALQVEVLVGHDAQLRSSLGEAASFPIGGEELVNSLSHFEAVQIMQAIIAHVHGFRAATMAEVDDFLKKKEPSPAAMSLGPS